MQDTYPSVNILSDHRWVRLVTTLVTTSVMPWTVQYASHAHVISLCDVNGYINLTIVCAVILYLNKATQDRCQAFY